MYVLNYIKYKFLLELWYRGDSRIFLMGWHRGDQEPVMGGPWEKSCAPTQVGWHKNGTAQVPGQLISLFISAVNRLKNVIALITVMDCD